MSPELDALLHELEAFGADNDRQHTERAHRMLNITRDTGELLQVLVLGSNAKRILEIGTSNGYSTLWLAEAARQTGGHVTTLEYNPDKITLSTRNFARAGLAKHITQKLTDAGDYLQKADTESVALIFLDSERSEYLGWWPDLRRVLARGGTLVVDNATSHAEQLVDFFATIREDADFTTALVPIGNGEFIAVRAR